ncbi:unnamed protein product [Mycena citricolor]|uniref:Secreted protein n=1 Tax=Mycena citricolor TaxID=2018698 RepID=A0AAD2HPC7_9AGAR|nr:unnamed protein product [Mycena citricolor]
MPSPTTRMILSRALLRLCSWLATRVRVGCYLPRGSGFKCFGLRLLGSRCNGRLLSVCLSVISVSVCPSLKLSRPRLKLSRPRVIPSPVVTRATQSRGAADCMRAGKLFETGAKTASDPEQASLC